MPLEAVGRHVYIFRGKRIMLDADVAALFHIPTFRLSEAVKRNRDRFPGDVCNRSHTGADFNAVRQNRARAALRKTATEARALQFQFIGQHVE